jgi:hypothetical protein
VFTNCNYKIASMKVCCVFCRYTNSIRMIEMFVESAFATVPERFTEADCFFSFGEDD